MRAVWLILILSALDTRGASSNKVHTFNLLSSSLSLFLSVLVFPYLFLHFALAMSVARNASGRPKRSTDTPLNDQTIILCRTE